MALRDCAIPNAVSLTDNWGMNSTADPRSSGAHGAEAPPGVLDYQNRDRTELRSRLDELTRQVEDNVLNDMDKDMDAYREL